MAALIAIRSRTAGARIALASRAEMIRTLALAAAVAV